jgi:hypothetical protein
MNRIPFSRALNSRHLESAAPLMRAPGLAILAPSVISRGAK